MTSFYEYTKDKIVAAVCNISDYVQIIDRSNPTFSRKVAHPAGITSVLQLSPIKFFDSDRLPYMFVRDKQNLTFYDIERNEAWWTLKSKQCDTTLYQMVQTFNEIDKEVCIDIIIWDSGNTTVQRY